MTALCLAAALLGAGGDVQDVVSVGGGRPTLLRLRPRLEGKPIEERWDAWMTRLFRYLDRDGSGGLGRGEAGKAPAAAVMGQFFQGEVPFTPGRHAVPFDQLDRDKDGKVGYEELCAYYRANGAGPVHVGGSFPGTGQDGVTDRLLALLDADGDGRLTKAEVRDAGRVLGRLDANDDEMVSVGELGAAAARATQLLILVPRGDGRVEAARAIVARLDRDRSGTLSPAEAGFAKDRFAGLDRNKDGTLDAAEVGRWLGGSPDGEFDAVVGNDPGTRMLDAATGRIHREGKKLSEATSLTVGHVRWSLFPVYSVGPAIDTVTPVVLQQFTLADRARQGFVVKKQLDVAMHPYLMTLFDLVDRDDDGKLAEEEVKEFLEVYRHAFGGQLTVSVTATGRGLFEVLDASGDGRLSVRELRDAWGRLAAFDADGDGAVAGGEFPRRYILGVSPQRGFAAAPQILVQSAPRAAPRTVEGGPVWFRKMDRNGDGDVSRLEWLGSREEFDRVDADRDGLIGVAEAEAADARWRKKR